MPRAGISLLVVAWGVSNTALAATISLVAVKLNGRAIAPTSAVHAEPGDVIETEIRISGWVGGSSDGWPSFTVTIAGKEGSLSGTQGEVLPLGWPGVFCIVGCLSDFDCPENNRCIRGCCYPPEEWGAYIDVHAGDFVFLGCPSSGAVAQGTLDFAYFAFARGLCCIFPAPSAYAGTLVLRVGSDAGGVFTFGFKTDPDLLHTYLNGCDGDFETPDTVPLTIDVQPPCEPDSSPPDCAVDARIPHAPNDPHAEFGWSELVLDAHSFGGTLAVDDFRVETVPLHSDRPTIVDFSEISPGWWRFSFDRIIPLSAWTCMVHRASGIATCIGRLPGDVDGDGVSHPEDVWFLIDELVSGFQSQLHGCDADRSGRCAPADILTFIDLQNGAEAFQPFRGRFMASCPEHK
ncbi:MAG: hypothetical protein AABZ12_08330 [Planctomycetota bacterium]